MPPRLLTIPKATWFHISRYVTVTFPLGFLSLPQVNRTRDAWLIAKHGEQESDSWCLTLVAWLQVPISPPKTSMFMLFAAQESLKSGIPAPLLQPPNCLGDRCILPQQAWNTKKSCC